MASIVSTGIGSGLDIAGIVQGLVAAEGQPVELRIGQNEAKAQSKLSAFGSLKATLSDFRDKLDAMKTADEFLSRRAISGNEDVFTAVTKSNALPAQYDLEVVQLAQSQKLTSGAFVDASGVRSPIAMASPVTPANPDAVIATSLTGTCQGPTS